MNNRNDKQINEDIQPEVRKKNGVPMIIRILAVVVAFLVVCEGTAILYGRDIVILLMGSKNYFGFVESQTVSPGLDGLSKQLFQLNSYNTLDLSSRVTLNGIDQIKGYKNSGQGGIMPFLESLAAGSTLDLKFGKNPAAKSFIAEYSAGSSSAADLSLKGYLSRDRLVFSLPQLTGKSLYIDKGSIATLQPLFDLAGSTFSSGAKPDQAQIDKALNRLASTALSSLGNKNVSISRNKTVTLGGEPLECDEITVRVSQQELSAILKNVLNSDNLNGDVAVAGVLSGDLDNIAAGGATMKIIVKNNLFYQQVFSQQIITGGGYGISLYEIDHKGGFSLQTPKSKLTGTFSEIDDRVNGTGSAVTSGVADASKFSFTLNKNVTTQLGFYTGTVRAYTTIGNKRFIVDASLSKDGDKSNLAVTAQNGGSDYYKAAFSFGASGGVLSVPAYDPSNSIDISSLSSVTGLSDLFGAFVK